MELQLLKYRGALHDNRITNGPQEQKEQQQQQQHEEGFPQHFVCLMTEEPRVSVVSILNVHTLVRTRRRQDGEDGQGVGTGPSHATTRQDRLTLSESVALCCTA